MAHSPDPVHDGQIIGTIAQLDLHGVADAMRSLSVDLGGHDLAGALQRLVDTSAERVPGAALFGDLGSRRAAEQDIE